MDKKETETIKNLIEEFFQKMTWDIILEALEIDDNAISLNLKSEEPEMLIGRSGKTLENAQLLLAKIISKKTGERVFVDLDINEYKTKKISYLREAAKSAADEVALTRKEKKLMPMPEHEEEK